MKAKTIVLFASVLLLTAAGYAQGNSCAYTFTYQKANFSFCVTNSGTLGMLQSPIGVDHLDPLNPVEGWSATLVDNSGGSDGQAAIPGLGIFNPAPTVQQPRGPGTLPLIFDYSDNFREIVWAAPYHREIV